MSKLKSFKVRHPVYNLYKDGKVVTRLHVIFGRLLPETTLRGNGWLNGLSSGQIKVAKNQSLSAFYPDNEEGLGNWVRHYKADRVTKLILEMEYKGYDQ